MTVCQELGIILENKVIKNSFIKKCAPKLLFLTEKNNREIQMILDLF